MGKYAGDRNVEIESKYGKEWLACVLCPFNPATGVPCIRNEPRDRFEADDKFPKYDIHEYRFNTSSSGWIAGPDSNYAEATAEMTFGECGQMTCRYCGDTYRPSETPRQKATLDEFMINIALIRLAAERGDGSWVNLSDPAELREFVDRVDVQAALLGTMAANIRRVFGTDFRPLDKLVSDMDRWAVDMRADLTQYVKTVKDAYGGHEDLLKACRKAKRIQAARK